MKPVNNQPSNAPQNCTLLITLTPEELEFLIRRVIREESVRPKDLEGEEVLLSPKEVCKVFQPAVTRQTLENWSKQGRFNKYWIGRSVFYKRSEILAAAKSLNRYTRLRVA